ncbi:hypothetical protein EVB87_050 [Rhizobium phage RHph_N28_1]|nr:hypothetical protein EVB87_050 [Rhizobium phage RHph_N28_1]QIG74078.1 hypothetical protein EVC07_050 [Rhizobium phage RHph_N42]QXV73738.1 hypothetical protein [Rhizobium phage RHph_N46]
MSKTKAIMAAIKDNAYLAAAPLQDYHAAQAVKAAMRRKEPTYRLSGVREALRQYRVSAWLQDDGKIVLRLNGVDLLTL